MRIVIRSAMLSILALSGAAQADPLADGKDVARLFFGDDPKTLWGRMTPDMQQLLGSAEALTATRETLRQQFGEEQAVISEETMRQGEHDVYQRAARWTKSPTPLLFVVSFDKAERIAGLWVRPQPVAAPSDRLDYRTKARLQLPFEGEWQVFWGGRTIEENYHAADPAQRFAVDVVIRKLGLSFAGNPMKLASYHCWDQPILAPGVATVVAAVDGLPDQEIGASDPANPAGNHVVLDFGGGEYGFLAHLREGSVEVDKGEMVVAGQMVGRCGNSGNSSEPHLHFHLQTTPELGRGEGLPAQFRSYIADGEPVADGEPIRGQRIGPK